MKEIYERPMIMVEEFSVNRAIASCADESDRDIIFDCMIGDQRDVTSVITSSCNRKAGSTDLTTTARTTGSHGYSTYTGGSWSLQNGTCTYYAPSDASGLIYFCSATNGGNCFSVSNGVLVHDSNKGKHDTGYHVQIAPVYGDINVGS